MKISTRGAVASTATAVGPFVRSRRVLAVSTALMVGLMIVSPAVAAKPRVGGSPSPVHRPTQASGDKGFFDARQGSRMQQAESAQKTLRKGAAADLKHLTKAVGAGARVSFDPATGTPSNIASEDGYLTGPSTSSAAAIALSYVRRHVADLGLASADLSSFKLRASYTDPIGTTHLSWEQTARGIPVFGNGLRAHVDKSGQLIAIQGSPIAGLASKAGAANDAPALSAPSARSSVGKDVGGETPSASATTGRTATRSTTWSNGDKASLVWFASGSGVKLGWNTYTQSGAERVYTHVVDAVSGKVLYRADLVDNDNADGEAYVYGNYPGASHGGKAKKVNFYSENWLSKNATWLAGKYAYVFSDVNDDDVAQDSEKGQLPSGAKLYRFGPSVEPLCKVWVCTWDPNTPGSWATNMRVAAANAFYLASTFHDYLKKAPFGFTAAAGNFEASGGDPVEVQTLDGADTAGGLPDAGHLNNSFMHTPPDGTPPTMRLYLSRTPGTTDAEEPFVPTSSAFDASVLLHEYTHGLSNRLVVDAIDRRGVVLGSHCWLPRPRASCACPHVACASRGTLS